MILVDKYFGLRNDVRMVLSREAVDYGAVLREPPETLSVVDTAQALRIPVTMLGDSLRRRTESASGTELSPSQARVLSQLSAGDSLTISTLAQSQNLAVSSMTEVVVRLGEGGLVRKEPSTEDRREVRVSITKRGRARLESALNARNEYLADRLHQLSDDDRAKVAAALPALWRMAGVDADIWPRLRVTSATAR
jgi:DNA-binding MarR family transcriptional regulator